MKNKAIKKTVLSALFLSIGLVLPFFTGQIREIGNMLLPMHLPVMLCGIICGGPYGVAVGFILPILRSLLFSMPAMYPSAIAMSFELATYGLVIHICYSSLKFKLIIKVYLSLIISMLSGRAVWGIFTALLLGLKNSALGFGAFIASAFTNAFLGIILQLILIPAIILTLEKIHILPSWDKAE